MKIDLNKKKRVVKEEDSGENEKVLGPRMADLNQILKVTVVPSEPFDVTIVPDSET